MISYNIDEYGQTIRVNIGQDVSAGTSFKMILEPYSGDKVEVTATLGTSDTVVGDETFEANKFVEYVTTSGVFPSGTAGKWRKKAVATLASSKIASDYSLFRVTE